MRSMTFSSSAFSAVIALLSTTEDLAHSALRPRFLAMPSMKLPVICSSFSFITSLVFSSPPAPMETGWAAPMLVPGAMAATSAASVMKQPALPAHAPSGSDIHDRRDLRSVELLDNLLGGIERAARGVELDDQAGVVALGGDINGAGDVAGGGRADGAVDLDQADIRRSQTRRGPAGQRRHQD